ncbi:MAG: hypothetical protein QNJ62_11735 [Methyloceanibacter sp.]|nr:hypothetical protein [Methyloceanibacter sp.]
MTSCWPALTVALVAIGVFAGQGAQAQDQGAPAQQKCATVYATDDGLHKTMAVKASLTALQQEIEALRAKRGLGQVSISPAQPTPNPYWRGQVTANLYQKPDIISSTAHTTCWRGVVSPSVCTSGAKVCW